MKYLKTASLLLLVLLTISSCKKEEDPIQECGNCDQETIISASEYNEGHDDFVGINSLEIEEDCLRISYSASGCDGSSWEVKLIDQGVVLESLPPQRRLRLSLRNEEACLAFITKETTFDISELRIDDGPVLLNITNNDGQMILYEY